MDKKVSNINIKMYTKKDDSSTILHLIANYDYYQFPSGFILVSHKKINA